MHLWHVLRYSVFGIPIVAGHRNQNTDIDMNVRNLALDSEVGMPLNHTQI